MSKFLSNHGQLARLVIYCLLIGLLIMLLSCIGIIFGQYGWLIGATIGTLVSALNVVLLFKGSGFALSNNKTSLFLLFYFARMFLYAGMTVLCAYLDYKVHIEVFRYSVFALLIAYLPMAVIVCVVMSKEKKNVLNIGELK